MNFGIYGESEINYIKPSGKKTVLIRIFCPTTKKIPELETKDLYEDILTLNIEDLSEKLETPEFVERLNKEFNKLNHFILNNIFDEIIVHCAAGLSRSPAIMICISKILGNYEIEKIVKDNFPIYNKCIVKNFNNYNYKQKNMKIDKVNFNGHFVSLNDDTLDEMIRELYVKDDSGEIKQLHITKKR